eukprot:s956_g4.t1
MYSLPVVCIVAYCVCCLDSIYFALMFRIVQPWKHCRGRSAIREARSWVNRPPGASKAPWVPADLTADDAPAQALRRAVQGRTLPKKAYVVPRLDRATWRWTDVRGDKIYYRQWSYSSRPTEAWLEGGMPKSMNRELGLTTLEAQRWRRCRTSANGDGDGLSLEDLRSLAKATSRGDQKAAGVQHSALDDKVMVPCEAWISLAFVSRLAPVAAG